jgi:hypothetical protein
MAFIDGMRLEAGNAAVLTELSRTGRQPGPAGAMLAQRPPLLQPLLLGLLVALLPTLVTAVGAEAPLATNLNCLTAQAGPGVRRTKTALVFPHRFAKCFTLRDISARIAVANAPGSPRRPTAITHLGNLIRNVYHNILYTRWDPKWATGGGGAPPRPASRPSRPSGRCPMPAWYGRLPALCLAWAYAHTIASLSMIPAGCLQLPIVLNYVSPKRLILGTELFTRLPIWASA